MTFIDRRFDEIVRDVLTNLTQGVTGEVHTIPFYDPEARPVVVPDIVLKRRPVRRVSVVSGKVQVPGSADYAARDFTLNDYELVPSNGDPEGPATIRFLPFGQRPAPGTDVVVNYYPRTTDPSVLNDVHVGSVVRTLVEAIGKELGVLYAQLNLAYDSAFVETATGSSLDRVVALLALRRYRAGRPVGSVRFSRRAGSPGEVFIPAGTPVTDAADKVRYQTVESRTMLTTESTTEVRIRGAAEATPMVEAGVLTVVQKAIAGVDGVTNDRATTTSTADETDDELRARARVALVGSNKGTMAALRDGLLQLPVVRAVEIQEMPNGVTGEVQVLVSLTDASRTTLPKAVEDKIEELRPAGILVLPGMAAKVSLQVRIALTLAGTRLPESEVNAVHSGVQAKLVTLVGKVGVGQVVRVGPLVAALLGDDPRIADVSLQLGVKGSEPGPPRADFSPPAGAAVALAPADVTFEPDAFAEQAGRAQQVPVQVRATVPVLIKTGVDVGAAKAQITARITSYFGALTAAAQVTAETILNTVRDEAKYAVDSLGLLVTLQAGDQFVQVAQGGQTFTVLDGHDFNVAAVDVTVAGTAL